MLVVHNISRKILTKEPFRLINTIFWATKPIVFGTGTFCSNYSCNMLMRVQLVHNITKTLNETKETCHVKWIALTSKHLKCSDNLVSCLDTCRSRSDHWARTWHRGWHHYGLLQQISWHICVCIYLLRWWSCLQRLSAVGHHGFIGLFFTRTPLHMHKSTHPRLRAH